MGKPGGGTPSLSRVTLLFFQSAISKCRGRSWNSRTGAKFLTGFVFRAGVRRSRNHCVSQHLLGCELRGPLPKSVLFMWILGGRGWGGGGGLLESTTIVLLGCGPPKVLRLGRSEFDAVTRLGNHFSLAHWVGTSSCFSSQRSHSCPTVAAQTIPTPSLLAKRA